MNELAASLRQPCDAGIRPRAGPAAADCPGITTWPAALITIDLPAGLSMAAARDVNSRAALREGVVVRLGAAHFSAVAGDALLEHGYAFAEGFTASRLSEAIGELLILRKRLTGARPLVRPTAQCPSIG
jgi:hypothetical protein